MNTPFSDVVTRKNSIFYNYTKIYDPIFEAWDRLKSGLLKKDSPALVLPRSFLNAVYDGRPILIAKQVIAKWNSWIGKI